MKRFRGGRHRVATDPENELGHLAADEVSGDWRKGVETDFGHGVAKRDLGEHLSEYAGMHPAKQGFVELGS